MTDMPSVSVVMPIYNAEPFLKQALDSVLGQTLNSIEVICVNDGSKDRSLDIMKEYASNDSRVKIIDKPNAGYGQTMNVGISACTGEYIGILEPDDYLKPTMYETLYKSAKEHDLDFVRSDYFRLTTDKNGIDHLQREPICFKSEYYDTVLNPQENLDLFNIRMENWTGIFKGSWIEEHDIRFNESPGAGFQDNGFWFQSYCWAKKIMVVNEGFYCYRVDNAASSINQTDKVFVMLDEYKWIEKWLRSKPALCSKFIGVFHYKKTHNCEFALNRLAPEFKLPFLRRYAEEYKAAYAANEIDESLFHEEELERLHALLVSPDHYLEISERQLDRNQRFNEARGGGRFSLFCAYAHEDGLVSALKRTLASIAK